MKKILTTVILGSFVLLMVNCSPKVGEKVTKGPVPSISDIKMAYSSDQLDQGKMIWQSHCNKCHKLYAPDSRPADKWNSILTRMITKAKLNVSEGKLVRAYLIANSQPM